MLFSKAGLPSTYYLSLAVDHQEELGHLQLNNPTLKDPMTYRMSQMSSLGFYSSAYAHVKKVATTLSPTKSSKTENMFITLFCSAFLHQMTKLSTLSTSCTTLAKAFTKTGGIEAA